jgi:prepilin-type N-terminal cleavage/methylation domain-containing protein
MMHAPRHNRTRTGGIRAFTLLELILAVAMMAIAMAAINGALFGAIRLRDHTLAAIEDALPVHQATTVIKRDLVSAMPPWGALSGWFKVGQISAQGQGQPVSIEFHTSTGVLHAYEPWGDVQRVTYEVKDPITGRRDQGKELVRSVTRNLMATITPTPVDQPLMTGVERVEILCFDGTAWQSTWDTTVNNTNLPVAVRFRIFPRPPPGSRGGQSSPIEILAPIPTMSVSNLSLTTSTSGTGN